MVRTLRNAFATGRIAHAFMLTGVRGVGKTTTARLLARALNYETRRHRRADARPGGGGPATAAPSSRAGTSTCWRSTPPAARKVDEMRELFDGVRYAPVEARYKVYIIDEVHMLSTAAFNALLKTLEEPPPHAKFIFATTEIRKVPVTILSRCQRFDLRRVEPDVIAKTWPTDRRGRGRADRARGPGADRPRRRRLGARRPVAAGPGDRAGRRRRARSPRPPIRDMLGLADRAQTIELFELPCAAASGRSAARRFRPLYGFGADPVIVHARPAGALPMARRSPRPSAPTRWRCRRTRRRGWPPSARGARPAAWRGSGRCCSRRTTRSAARPIRRRRWRWR